MSINTAPSASAPLSNGLVGTMDYFFDNILGLDKTSSLADVQVIKTDDKTEIKIKISATLGSGVTSLAEYLSIPLDNEKITKYLSGEINITDGIKNKIKDYVEVYVNKAVENVSGYERGVATVAASALKNLLSARITGDIAHELGASLTELRLPDLDAAFNVSLTSLASAYYNLFIPDVLKTYGKLGISEILDAATNGLNSSWVTAIHAIQGGILEPILSNIVDKYFGYGPFLPNQIFNHINFTNVFGKIASDLLVDYDALDKDVIDDFLGLDGHGWIDTQLAPLLTKGLNDLVEGSFVKSLEFLAGEFSTDDLKKLFDSATDIGDIQELLGSFFTKKLGQQLTDLFVNIDSLEESLVSQLGSIIVSKALGETLGSLASSAITGLFGEAAASAIGAAIFKGVGAVLGAGVGGVIGSLVFEALDHLFHGALSGLIGDLLDWIRNDSPQSFYRVVFNYDTNGFEYGGQYHKDSNANLDHAVKAMADAFENSVEQVIAFIGQPASLDPNFDDFTMVWGKKHYDEKFAAYRENQEPLRTAFNGNATIVVNGTIGLVLRHMDFHTGDPIIAKAYETWKAQVGVNASDLAYANADNLELLQSLVSLARFANQYRQNPTLFDTLVAGDTPIGITILQQFLQAQALGFNDAAVLRGSVLKTEEIGSAAAGDTIYLDGPAWRAVARGGNDTIYAGPAARQEIDGGAGTDVLVLAKAREAYDLTRIDRADHFVVLKDRSSGAQITVHDVETFNFAGTVLSLDQAFPNHRPAFQAGGGADRLSLTLPSTGAFITSLSAKDADNDPLTYLISGTDADRFMVGEAGRLEFRTAPGADAPTDKDGDGVYEITVTASDGFDTSVQSYYIRPASSGAQGSFVFGGAGDDTIGLYLTSVGQPKATLGNDLLYGRAGNDTIYGDKGDDYLNGGDGDDVLGGDDGDDIIQGGIGDDRLYGWIGADHLYGADGRDLLLGDWGDDTLDGGSGDDTLFGYDGDDVLHGGTGNDIVEGDAGNDILDGGDGSDTIDGGEGTDTVTYASAGSRVEVDLSILEDQASRGAGVDTLISIEGVVGSAFDDVLAGNAGANLLSGENGTDVLWGGAGADSVWGGAGDDWLEGGDGSDTIDGGAGSDTVTYASAGSRIEVDLSLLEDQLTRGAGVDTLISVENVIGSAFDDVLAGNAGANLLSGENGADVLSAGAGDDSVWGGAGDDWLEGGDGSDTIDGGEGTDTVTYASAGSRIEVDLSLLEGQITRGAGVDILLSVENAVGSGFNDILVGNAGVNRLDGGGGDDRLEGAGGADVLVGGAGVDRFVFTSLSDSATSAPDRIVDFTRGDLIDLSAIDTNMGAPGDQAFHFGATIGRAGDITLAYDASANRTIMNLYVDSDNVADALIWIDGNVLTLTATDFIL